MRRIVISFAVLYWVGAMSCGTSTPAIVRPYVNDEINLLTAGQRDSLTAIMEGLENTVGSQMAVLIISSLNGASIEEYSINIANSWGLGRKDYNDGVLITVALQDRRMRIEVGTGLEKVIPDETAARIIQEHMVPAFRKERYFEGIYSAVTRMRDLIVENRQLIGQSND